MNQPHPGSKRNGDSTFPERGGLGSAFTKVGSPERNEQVITHLQHFSACDTLGALYGDCPLYGK